MHAIPGADQKLQQLYATEHARTAVENEPAYAETFATDDDFAACRADPRFAARLSSAG